MKQKEKILICYNKPALTFTDYSGKGLSFNNSNFSSETEIVDNLNEIISILSDQFESVNSLQFDGNITSTINLLNNFSPDICLNFVESADGNSSYESYVTGLYELLRYTYTGNTPLCLATCLNKELTKSLLKANGVSTPSFVLIEPKTNLSNIKHNLSYPLILKLNSEDAGIGINENSVVYTDSELIKQATLLFKIFNKTIIAEEYIEGREFNIAILGNEVLPIAEISFDTLPSNLPKIVTYEAKWSEQSLYYKGTIPICPANITNEQEKLLKDIALKSFKTLKCRDYARIDIRMNKNNVPFVLEVNPNPDIMKDSGFANSAKTADITYPLLLTKIINLAIKRKIDDTNIKQAR